MESSASITHLAFSDLNGGANLAAYRLHSSLHAAGSDSSMLVRLKMSDDTSVREFDTGSRCPERIYRAWRRHQIDTTARKISLNPGHASPSLTDPRTEWGPSLLRQLPDQTPLHLHWVNRFIDWPTFFRAMERSRRPVFWTLHDMTSLTGGCGYDFGCGRFSNACGHCPQLLDPSDKDLSARFFQIKLKAMAKLATDQLVLLPPNQWMNRELARSPLLSRFRREVVPYGIEVPVGVAPPPSRSDSDPFNLIAAAVDIRDQRKNLSLLLAAIAGLADSHRTKVRLTLIGQGDPPDSTPCPVTTTGYISSPEALNAHYAAADLYLHPALEDNQPNTVLEAMAVGTPALVCDTGGVAEMIPTDHNWPMVVPRDNVEAMTRALQWWIDNRHQAATAGQHCRSHVEKHFSRRLQVERHVKLYESVGGGQ